MIRGGKWGLGQGRLGEGEARGRKPEWLRCKGETGTTRSDECWMSVQKMLALLKPRGLSVTPTILMSTFTHTNSTPPSSAHCPTRDRWRQMDVEGPHLGRRWLFGVMLLNSSQHKSGWLIWTAVDRICPDLTKDSIKQMVYICITPTDTIKTTIFNTKWPIAVCPRLLCGWTNRCS